MPKKTFPRQAGRLRGQRELAGDSNDPGVLDRACGRYCRRTRERVPVRADEQIAGRRCAVIEVRRDSAVGVLLVAGEGLVEVDDLVHAR